MREVRPPFSPEGVVTEFCNVLRRYKITRVTGDRYAGEWPREQFAKHGIKYEPSRDPKGAIYLNLLPLVNSAKVRLLGSQRLVRQLIGLERNTSRGGRDSIDHARGAHDDLANAAAGALLMATARQPHVWVGGCGYGGRVSYLPKNNPHMLEPRLRDSIRFVRLTEQEDLKRRGLL